MLQIACDEGHREAALVLLEAKADINAQDNEGSTPLFLASHGGYPGLVAMLLGRNADISIRTTFERSRLASWCCGRGTSYTALETAIKEGMPYTSRLHVCELCRCLQNCMSGECICLRMNVMQPSKLYHHWAA